MARILRLYMSAQNLTSLAHKATFSTAALSSPVVLRGASKDEIPPMIYGTAWKKERTADLVYLALKSGFRAIDTAAQPRHYQEKLVGDGIRRAIADGIVSREDLFIQTKYTPPSGQDPKDMPYDATLPIPSQIQASVASSLQNLNTGANTYLDSVLLHSPLRSVTITIAAWRTLSAFVQSGQIKYLGISNVDFSTLAALNEEEIKPTIVQNRFYAKTGYEVQLREFCRQEGIVFQSFWTLTGNPRLRGSEVVKELADLVSVSEEVAMYALVLGLGGISVLNGTTREESMKEDLVELQVVSKWAADSPGKWKEILLQFKALIANE